MDKVNTQIAPGPLLLTWINFNSSIINNNIHYKVWDEIIVEV